MQDLLKYIRSSFNYTHDIDTKNDAVNPKLQLPENLSYNVFVTPIDIPGYSHLFKRYSALVQKALDEWAAALDNRIKCKVVYSLQGANVKLYWIKSKRCYAARQNWDANLIMPMPVLNIGIMDMHETLYTEDEVYHLLLHEFGHILRLGHSTIDGDVMSCKEYWPTKLSDNDIFVLRLLYDLGSGVSYKEAFPEIEKRVNAFLQSKKGKNAVSISNKVQSSFKKPNTKDLLGTLESIEEVLKYNLTLQHIELDGETRRQFLKRKYVNNSNMTI